MANNKIVDREGLKAFRQANDTRYKNGSVVVGKSLTTKQIENINDEVGSTQTAPFNFQATGTDNNTTETPTAPVAKHLELRGNSVVWNQLVDNDTSSLTLISGHKYLTVIDGVREIITSAGETINVTGGTDQVFDLTLMYGTGNEQTTVLEFIRDYPLPYYEYNAGTLKSCKSSKLITIGCNAFDGVLEQGSINENTGADESSVNMVRSSQYIPVIIGQVYKLTYTYSGSLDGKMAIYYDKNNNCVGYAAFISDYDDNITIPANVYYMRLRFYKSGGLTPSELSNVMLRLDWNEAHDYVEYVKHEYNLPQIELKSAGSVYDTITPDGVHTKRIDVVDLGTLDWYWQSQDNRWYSTGLQQTAKPVNDNNTKANMIAEKYEVKSLAGTGSSIDSGSGLSLSTTGTLFLYTSDSVNSPSGKLYFELATSIVSEESAFAENIEVDDFGTMEFVPSADNLEPIIPQGNKFFYPADYVLFIDDLYNRSKDGGSVADVDNFVTQSELANVGDAENLADEYSSSSTYDLGDLVIHDNVLYKCTTAITTAEAWNSSHWTATTIKNEFVNLSIAQTITATKTFNSNIRIGITGSSYGKNLIFSGGNINRDIYVRQNQYNLEIFAKGNSDGKVLRINNGSEAAITLYHQANANCGIIVPNTTGWTSSKTIATTDIFAPTSYSLSDGGTITDSTLKTLIQNEQPIKLNGFTCYFSCDDGTNYQYVSTRYDSSANKNHINVITINKSTWVATFHTSDIALS